MESFAAFVPGAPRPAPAKPGKSSSAFLLSSRGSGGGGDFNTPAIEIVNAEWKYENNDRDNYERIVSIKEQRRMGTARVANKGPASRAPPPSGASAQAPEVQVRGRNLPPHAACRIRLWSFGPALDRSSKATRTPPQIEGEPLTSLRKNRSIEVLNNVVPFGEVQSDGYKYAAVHGFITRGARVKCRNDHIAFKIDVVFPEDADPTQLPNGLAPGAVLTSVPWIRSARMSISEKVMCPRDSDKKRKASSTQMSDDDEEDEAEEAVRALGGGAAAPSPAKLSNARKQARLTTPGNPSGGSSDGKPVLPAVKSEMAKAEPAGAREGISPTRTTAGGGSASAALTPSAQPRGLASGSRTSFTPSSGGAGASLLGRGLAPQPGSASSGSSLAPHSNRNSVMGGGAHHLSFMDPTTGGGYTLFEMQQQPHLAHPHLMMAGDQRQIRQSRFSFPDLNDDYLAFDDANGAAGLELMARRPSGISSQGSGPGGHNQWMPPYYTNPMLHLQPNPSASQPQQAPQAAAPAGSQQISPINTHGGLHLSGSNGLSQQQHLMRQSSPNAFLGFGLSQPSQTGSGGGGGGLHLSSRGATSSDFFGGLAGRRSSVGDPFVGLLSQATQQATQQQSQSQQPPQQRGGAPSAGSQSGAGGDPMLSPASTGASPLSQSPNLIGQMPMVDPSLGSVLVSPGGQSVLSPVQQAQSHLFVATFNRGQDWDHLLQLHSQYVLSLAQSAAAPGELQRAHDAIVAKIDFIEQKFKTAQQLASTAQASAPSFAAALTPKPPSSAVTSPAAPTPPVVAGAVGASRGALGSLAASAASSASPTPASSATSMTSKGTTAPSPVVSASSSSMTMKA